MKTVSIDILGETFTLEESNAGEVRCNCSLFITPMDASDECRNSEVSGVCGLIVAQYKAGIDVLSPEYIEALTTVVSICQG